MPLDREAPGTLEILGDTSVCAPTSLSITPEWIDLTRILEPFPPKDRNGKRRQLPRCTTSPAARSSAPVFGQSSENQLNAHGLRSNRQPRGGGMDLDGFATSVSADCRFPSSRVSA